MLFGKNYLVLLLGVKGGVKVGVKSGVKGDDFFGVKSGVKDGVKSGVKVDDSDAADGLRLRNYCPFITPFYNFHFNFHFNYFQLFHFNFVHQSVTATFLLMPSA